MKVGPFFKWFGSKWMNAINYPYPYGKYIIEPFAGSAGYSCNYSENNVILWDDDTYVKDLWSYLIYEAESKDILTIPINIPIGTDIHTLDLSKGQKLLLKHWQRTNNVGECWTISPWGNKPGQWTANTRTRIANQIQYIKHWKVQPTIDFVDYEKCTWFIDPPYQFNYRYSRNLIPFNYGGLCSLVQTINSKSLIIVCEAKGKEGQVPVYLPFTNSFSSVTSRRKQSQSHHSNELIYIRYPNK